MSLLAYWLRNFNSKLVFTSSFAQEKILKVIYFFSLILYKKAPRSPVPQAVIITNYDGDISMKVDRSQTIGACIYWTGFHELKELMWLHRFLTPHMVVVDIGANQGEYTLFAAKRVTFGRVLAFEPMPSMYNLLCDNITLNNYINVDVFALGLSDKAGSLELYNGLNENEGLGTFYPGDTSLNSITVSLNTLDQLFKLKRLDFIKMDIEGSELYALRGAHKVIKTYRPYVMIEINESAYTAAGYTIPDVLQFFSDLNYNPFHITKGGVVKPCISVPTFGNLLFVPQ